jgi:hypothetical protein
MNEREREREREKLVIIIIIKQNVYIEKKNQTVFSLFTT